MKELKFNGNYLEMEDSIDELLITDFQTYNRYVMLDSGIGSDVNSITNHISTIRRYISKDDKANANKELNNLHQNIVFVITNTSPKMNAFVALIRKLNGKEIDKSDPAKVIDVLSKKGLTIGKLNGFLDFVKKKLS